VRLYRIADSRYQPESGAGARLYGGRWNSPGRAVIYACTHYSGAMLEKLVHTNGRLPKHQVCVTYELPRGLVPAVLDAAEIRGWDAEDQVVARAAGDAWLEAAKDAVLLVPSVVFPDDHNALINPAHADMKRVKVVGIAAVKWDRRLFGSARGGT
jgi:RES domain-containing protein